MKYLKYQGRIYKAIAAPKPNSKVPKLRLSRTDLQNLGLVEVDGECLTLQDFLAMKNPRVQGDLDLADRKKLLKLPSNLHVGGNLDLWSSGISELPQGLKVGGFLGLAGTAIRKLPEDLKVGGNLDLSGLKLTNWPKHLHIGGDLLLFGSGMESIPSGVVIAMDLYLQDSQVEVVEPGVRVGGRIFINKDQKVELPPDLEAKVVEKEPLSLKKHLELLQ